MKQKKMLLGIVLALIVTQASLYAVEVSIGFTTPGIGLGILRGDSVQKVVDLAQTSGLDDMEKITPFSFAPAFQTDIMIEFLPFLALETGVGFSMSTVMYQQVYDASASAPIGTKNQLLFSQTEVVIPIMLRMQHEFERFLVYGAVGVKLGIPVSKGYLLSQTITDDNLSVDFSENASLVNLDIAFSLGSEYRIAGAHYIGLRLGYDLNVISPLDSQKYADSINGNASNFEDVYQDNFSASLTYRYAFNSKWNK